MDTSTAALRPPPPPIVAFIPISPPPDPSLPQPPPPLPFSSPQQIFPVGILDNYIPPPFPDSPRSVDLSPLAFILALMAVITIPALIYAFVFAIRWPTWPSHDIPHRRPVGDDMDISAAEGGAERVVSGMKYRKEAHVKEMGSECPVCLSAFADGEDIRQLSLCKHSFHVTCIDMWLSNHSNCPICRADVPVKRANNAAGILERGRYHVTDLQQGLPDAANLV